MTPAPVSILPPLSPPPCLRSRKDVASTLFGSRACSIERAGPSQLAQRGSHHTTARSHKIQQGQRCAARHTEPRDLMNPTEL
ncbi:hypothetical protein ElyMa_002112800 [Elysia marginata]|uniref:Uncharacterized protein n=1 Tax=Elysia marginata TaxID=1093978 RepID=A0AAV4FJ11_9GAST|nr:hypothetical protein ElyMa_002112800 [Elysia marginata]